MQMLSINKKGNLFKYLGLDLDETFNWKEHFNFKNFKRRNLLCFGQYWAMVLLK